MNDRERFHRLFRGEEVDRPPLLDEGVRDEVLEKWRTEGMPRDRTHLEIFGLTEHERVGPNLRFRDEYAKRILELSIDEYRKAFDVAEDRFPDDWGETVARLKDRETLAGIWSSRGFFQALGVHDWSTFEPVLVELIRNTEQVHKRMEIYGDFCTRMLERTLQDLEPDFLYISEPISDNRGPLVSPEMFDTFMLPIYEKLIGTAKARGIEAIIASTYGNTATLFPSMIRAGVNFIWVSEAAETPDMDYRELRRRLGPEIGLMGGIPLSILRSGSEDEIEAGVREFVTPLLEGGRYVPLAGGRIREEVPWSAYKRYREAIAGITSRA
jgi:uroporphyrinogen-III decarboxylase